MTRYLKALGLAMMAAFAFSAMSAASASAQEGMLTSDSTEVTLRGVEDPNGTNAFTAFGSEVTCPDTIYTGHKTLTEEQTNEGATHSLLHSGEAAVTITPHYAGCNNEVHMNECDYDFYDFTTTGEGETYGFEVDVVCPPEKEITITGFCTVHVPPQEGITGLHATNEGGKVRIHGTAHNVTARLPCLGSHTSEAKQHQDVEVEGLDELGGPTGISISH